MVHLYLLILLLLPVSQGFAQSSIAQSSHHTSASNQPITNQFEHLSVTEGLSNNSVNCIIQDQEGFMWFGTNEGLNKYDGYTFTIFRPNPTNPTHSFQSSRITYLYEDRSNRLWAITEGGGLHEVNKQTGLVTPHLIKARHQWNNQLTIYEDSQGVLWITTFAGLVRYEPDRHRFRLYSAPEPDLPIKTVFEDRQHRFWVATNRGLYLFDRSTGQFTLVPVQVTNGLQPAFMSFYLDDNDVLWMGTATAGYSLFQLDLRRQPWHLKPYNPNGQLNPYTFLNSLHRDKKGILWVGTTNGLQGINTTQNRVFTYRSDLNTLKGISSNNAQVVYHDHSGILWVGTDNGIDRQAVNVKPFKIYQVTPNKGSVNLPENRVNAVLKDSYNQLWLTNLSNVYRMAANKAYFDVIPPEKLGSVGKHKNLTYSLLSDSSAGIWLGTPDGLYHFDQASGSYRLYPSDIPTQFIVRAPTGNLWVGGEGGIASFNVRTHQYRYYKAGTSGLPDRYVHSLRVSRKGDVWVLLKQQGISRLNPASGQFTHYTAGPRGHLSSNDVQSLYEDDDGIIWIGTHLGGLNRFDPRTGIFTVISSQDGIPGNNVVSITGDNAGYLWLSTDKGLCQFDPRTKTVHNYELKNGLPSNDFMDNAVFRHNNDLFFGSLNGAVRFNPARFRQDGRPFPVYITALSVLNQPRPITDSLVRLKYNENFLAFEFSALDYVLPEQNHYAYQLVGVDKDWIQNGNRHLANYTNLSPGSYTFRVKAANSDEVWSSREASLQLIIHPPWWRTWWAYLLYVLTFGGLLWAYIVYRSRALRRENRVLEEKVRLRTNQVQQQKEEIEAQRDYLEETLNELKSTQAQLIQKEKLASLGELTAGIAHEIQNPLNFVNNFAEVSTELLEEQKEALVKGNTQEAQTIADNLTQNLQKIHHHGNRASRIVQGMLEHSRTDSGEKRATDLNALAQEYLRVAYHGLRANDKSFNCELVTSLDPTLGSVEVAPQEIGRVLLNLYNNAFYAVARRAMQRETTDYQPTVTVSTVKTQNGVQIRIGDNGIGIPDSVKAKIFQPFFTTKPTGEGTGLGLSLSYDIITKGHQGSLSVSSQDGQGSEFIIQLPTYTASVPY